MNLYLSGLIVLFLFLAGLVYVIKPSMNFCEYKHKIIKVGVCSSTISETRCRVVIDTGQHLTVDTVAMVGDLVGNRRICGVR